MSVTHWPPEMEAIERLAERDIVLSAALSMGTAHALPSLTVLSVAWRMTMRAARGHVEDIERLTGKPSPATLAMLAYLARLWRETAFEETPRRWRRRHWRRVAETRIGLLCAAARERAALLRLAVRAHELYWRPQIVIGPIECAGAPRPGEQ